MADVVKTDKPLTNKEYAAQDKKFLAACENASIKATSRQASKFRMGFGKAFKEQTRQTA